MNYYLDTEFLEGTQKKRFLGISYGNTKPTIDLISIGIIGEDNREYYAICKEFNLKEAWYRTQPEPVDVYMHKKNYWIRDNILKPIWNSWKPHNPQGFTYKNFKRVLKSAGKTRKQIAQEVLDFTGYVLRDFSGIYSGYMNRAWDDSQTIVYYKRNVDTDSLIANLTNPIIREGEDAKPVFYSYYGNYDWVVFMWLWGTMINRPEGFPMFQIDLKPMVDSLVRERYSDVLESNKELTFKKCLAAFKKHPDYPKNDNTHIAIEDARFNKLLHELIIKLNDNI